MTAIKLSDLRPNPFRDLTRLPTKPEKVAVLKESIKETSFWDNVVCRKAANGAGGYELAYGHNRLEALRQLKWGEVNIPVRDLTNEMMAKIMVRENHEEWGAYAEVDAEAVRSVIRAYADDRLALPKVSGSPRGGSTRVAPSFVAEIGLSRDNPKSYTAGSLAKFLGWPESKTIDILDMLAFQESNPAAKGVNFNTLSPRQARVVVTETKRVERETGDASVAADIGKTLANEFRSASGKPRGRSKADKRAVSIHTAKTRANELMREKRVARRQAATQAKVDKLNLQKENRQVKQFLDACKVFRSAMQAAGKATSKFSPEAKRFSIRRLSELSSEIVLLKGRLG